MRQRFYWFHMTNDAHTTVRDCQSRARNWQACNQKRKLRPFPLMSFWNSSTSTFWANNPNQGRKSGHRGDGQKIFSTKVIFTGNTTAANLDHIVINDWVVNFRISARMLTDNEPQCFSKFFHAILVELSARLSATIKYRRPAPTNRPVERYSVSIIARPRHLLTKNRSIQTTI